MLTQRINRVQALLLRPEDSGLSRFRANWPLFAFAPFTALMLFCDSRVAHSMGIDTAFIPNILIPLYLLLMLLSVGGKLRLMILLTIPYSFLGEILCSEWVGFYHYKAGAIPFYVPLGHAIVFSTGFLVARRPLLQASASTIRKVLITFFVVAMLAAAILLHDYLSLVFGAIFFGALYLKKADPLYLIMGLIVLYVELVGTALGCWSWRSPILGVLTTTNPPVGSIVFYILGDMLIVSTVALLLRVRAIDQHTWLR